MFSGVSHIKVNVFYKSYSYRYFNLSSNHQRSTSYYSLTNTKKTFCYFYKSLIYHYNQRVVTFCTFWYLNMWNFPIQYHTLSIEWKIFSHVIRISEDYLLLYLPPVFIIKYSLLRSSSLYNPRNHYSSQTRSNPW